MKSTARLTPGPPPCPKFTHLPQNLPVRLSEWAPDHLSFRRTEGKAQEAGWRLGFLMHSDGTLAAVKLLERPPAHRTLIKRLGKAGIALFCCQVEPSYLLGLWRKDDVKTEGAQWPGTSDCSGFNAVPACTLKEETFGHLCDKANASSERAWLLNKWKSGLKPKLVGLLCLLGPWKHCATHTVHS